MASRGSRTYTHRSLALAVLILVLLAACKSTQPANAGHGGLTPITRGPVVLATPSASALKTASAHPTPTTVLTLRPRPTGTPRPTLTVHAPIVRLGDLTIRLARGDCGFYSDTSGGLWLNPRLVVGWTGAGPFPSTDLGFNMATNYGKATAGGPISSTTPFTWAIGGEPAVNNAWLGHTVKITVTLAPAPGVESNTANDVTVITVAVPSPLPFAANGSDGDYTIPCS
jgi:hypothetical protein